MASLLGGFAGLGGGSIGRASVDLVLNSTVYSEQLAKAEGETKAATGNMGKGFSGFQNSVKSSFSSAQLAIIGFGAVAVVAITKAIGATQEWAGEVRSLQRVTGQTAESASALAGAGTELGISVDQLNIGFGLLAKNIVNSSANLTKYGIATKDATGNVLPFDQVLAAVSDKFATLPKGPEQAAFAMNVFGRSGKALIPILQQGSAGLADLEQKAKDAGLVMSQDDLEASKQLSIAQRQLGEAFKGAAIQLGTSFVPVMTGAAKILTGIIELVQKIPGPVLAIGAGGVAAAAGVIILSKAMIVLKGTLTGIAPWMIEVTALMGEMAQAGEESALQHKIDESALRGLTDAYRAHAITSDQVRKATDVFSQSLGLNADALFLAVTTGIDYATALQKVNAAADAATTHIDALGHTVHNFAGKTQADFKSWKDGLSTSMNFVEAKFDDLASKAHLTAKKLLAALEQAARDQLQFRTNAVHFLTDVETKFPKLGTAAEQMVADLANQGAIGAHELALLANATESQQRRMLRAWEVGARGPQALIGAIQRARAEAANPIDINVNVAVRQSGGAASLTASELRAIIAQEMARGSAQ